MTTQVRSDILFEHFNMKKRGFHASSSVSQQQQQNPYKVLGVQKNATQPEIKKAYFALAKKYHPDAVKNATDKERQLAKERFAEIQNAYEILGDEKKRAQFDQFGTVGEGFPGGGQQGLFVRSLFEC
jgi:molecular chaperone DnaJ